MKRATFEERALQLVLALAVLGLFGLVSTALAAPTAPAGGTVKVSAPLTKTGQTVGCTPASASSGGCLTNVAGQLVVDAGFRVAGATTAATGPFVAAGCNGLPTGAVNACADPTYMNQIEFYNPATPTTRRGYIWADSTTGGNIASNGLQCDAPSGTNAIVIKEGARVCMNLTCTGYISCTSAACSLAGRSLIVEGEVIEVGSDRDSVPRIAHWSGHMPGAASGASVIVDAMRFTAKGTTRRFGVTTLIAGTGASSFTAELYNATTTTVLCTRTVACTGTTSNASCVATWAKDDDLQLRVVGMSDCTTKPDVNISAQYEGM